MCITTTKRNVSIFYAYYFIKCHALSHFTIFTAQKTLFEIFKGYFNQLWITSNEMEVSSLNFESSLHLSLCEHVKKKNEKLY